MSLFPLYDKVSLTSNDTLAGKWEFVDENGSKPKDSKPGTWTIAKNGDGYSLTIPNTGDKEVWRSVIHLVKFGDDYFLDVEPDTVKYTKATAIPFPTIEAHFIGRIWIEKDSVHMAFLGEDWLKDARSKGNPPLPAVDAKDSLVVTATTEQLQAFARKYAGDKDAFSESYYLHRTR